MTIISRDTKVLNVMAKSGGLEDLLAGAIQSSGSSTDTQSTSGTGNGTSTASSGTQGQTGGLVIESTDTRTIASTAKSGGLEDLLAGAIQSSGSGTDAQGTSDTSNGTSTASSGTQGQTGGLVIESTDTRTIASTAKSGGLEDLLAGAIQSSGSGTDAQGTSDTSNGTSTASSGTQGQTGGLVIESTDTRTIASTAKSGQL